MGGEAPTVDAAFVGQHAVVEFTCCDLLDCLTIKQVSITDQYRFIAISKPLTSNRMRILSQTSRLFIPSLLRITRNSLKYLIATIIAAPRLRLILRLCRPLFLLLGLGVDSQLAVLV